MINFFESHKLESLVSDNREFVDSLQTSKIEADSLRGEVFELVSLLWINLHNLCFPLKFVK